MKEFQFTKGVLRDLYVQATKIARWPQRSSMRNMAITVLTFLVDWFISSISNIFDIWSKNVSVNRYNVCWRAILWYSSYLTGYVLDAYTRQPVNVTELSQTYSAYMRISYSFLLFHRSILQDLWSWRFDCKQSDAWTSWLHIRVNLQVESKYDWNHQHWDIP